MSNFSANRIVIIVVICFCILSAISCSKGNKTMDSIAVNTDTLPMMHSEHVSSLISDSGITRYRLKAEIWEVYQTKDPYWYFPKGFNVEKFDSIFRVEGSIKSDTAYYFDKRGLWHLIGNVEVMNLDKERFETEELFWNERNQKIYSDKKIRIEQKDKIILGEGFESNQSMTDYNIFKTNAVIYVTEKEAEKEE